MKNIWSIASKELRSYFGSWVALLVVAPFLIVTLLWLFFIEKFFARGLADLRPMFSSFPYMLVLLVPAVTMRLWSEERRLGTIEVLLTLPIPPYQLVVGKFLAGLALISIALGLTLGVPITTAMIGDLDWGPVIGGYFGALLLASTYLAIGLFISSLTRHQVVALLMTIFTCLFLVLPSLGEIGQALGGSDSKAEGFDRFIGVIGNMIYWFGTGGHFESIARGVIDIRDFAFFVGLTCFFLVLNVARLRSMRWSQGPRTARERWNTRATLGLIFVNVFALNLWLSPLATARIDLTEHNEYSLTPVTRKLIRSADEPLLIRAYISDKTHPLIKPLIPQIRDLLREYDIAGGAKIRVEFVDPLGDKEAEEEAAEQFNIVWNPFKFEGHREQSIIKAYFAILVKYGDQNQVLKFGDLTQITPRGATDIDVKLKNLEYNLTSSIKKVIYGFQDAEAVFAALPQQAELTAFLTPDSLPESLATVPEMFKKIGDELAKKSGGKLVYKTEAPAERDRQIELAQTFGIRPTRVSILSNQIFYLALLLRVGDRAEVIGLPQELTEAAVTKSVNEALRRAAPGFQKTIGLWVPPAPPQQQPRFPGAPPQGGRPPQGFDQLRGVLSKDYTVRPLDLKSGEIASDIDIAVIAGPDKLDVPSQKAIDQYLMRGGTVVVLAGRRRYDLSRRSLDLQSVSTGLEAMLKSYGVDIADKMVLDKNNDKLAVPKQRTIGGMRVMDFDQVDFPYFVKVGQSGMKEKALTSGLPAISMHFASPIIEVEPKANPDGDKPTIARSVIMSSSADSWLRSGASIGSGSAFDMPDNLGKQDKGPFDLAVVLTGDFVSHFAKKSQAKEGDKGKEADKPDPASKPDRALSQAPSTARLIVLGSSAFVSSEAMAVSDLGAGQRALEPNFLFMQNLIEWGLAEDMDLLALRGRGDYLRVFEIKDDEKTTWEFVNYGIALMGLLLVGVVSFLRRRTLAPLELPPPSMEFGGRSQTATSDAKATVSSKGGSDDEGGEQENNDDSGGDAAQDDDKEGDQ